jgi:hypothetical protein
MTVLPFSSFVRYGHWPGMLSSCTAALAFMAGLLAQPIQFMIRMQMIRYFIVLAYARVKLQDWIKEILILVRWRDDKWRLKAGISNLFNVYFRLTYTIFTILNSELLWKIKQTNLMNLTKSF